MNDFEYERLKVRSHLVRAQILCEPATLTIDEWVNTLHRYGNMCAYCLLYPYEVLEHISPIGSGVGTTAENCVPACKRCNSRKYSYVPHSANPIEEVRAHIIAVAKREVKQPRNRRKPVIRVKVKAIAKVPQVKPVVKKPLVPNPEPNKIYILLEHWRTRKEMTTQQLAKEANVIEDDIKGIEASFTLRTKEDRNPAIFLKLATALNITTEELIVDKYSLKIAS